MEKGTLYLIPTPLGDKGPFNMVPFTLPPYSSIRYFIVEDIRAARRYLRSSGFVADFDTVTFFEMGKHSDPAIYRDFLSPALEGIDVGLMSEAGMPCIADPGSLIVAYAHELRVKVVPIPGPSSIFLALAASGLNGQHFEFHGYLPIHEAEVRRKIQQIGKECLTSSKSHIFIETPFRCDKLLRQLTTYLPSDIKLCIATELTQPGESIITRPVAEWSRNLPSIGKKPTVFVVGV